MLTAVDFVFGYSCFLSDFKIFDSFPEGVGTEKPMMPKITCVLLKFRLNPKLSNKIVKKITLIRSLEELYKIHQECTH